MMQPVQTHSPQLDRPKRVPIRITVTLPPSDYDAVVRISKAKRVSASWVVRDAVASYVTAEAPANDQSPS
jgi:hypothetical protein